jgi:lipoyl(octanoyl) transferase
MKEVIYTDLGLKDYKEVWDYQDSLLKQLVETKTEKSGGEVKNYLLFVEHPHVFTLGKSGKENNLLISDDLLESIQADFYRIDRGGDITYHGPGQLVGYPIFDLDAFGLGVKAYIHNIEQSIIVTLAEFGITASCMEGATGVWIDVDKPGRSRKICAIGVKVSRSVTMHGFALNVNTDLNYFRYINPCGFINKGVTSIKKELNSEIPMEKVKDLLLINLQKVFQFETIHG